MSAGSGQAAVPYGPSVRSKSYGADVLGAPRTPRRPPPPAVAAQLGMVVEHRESGWCGAIVLVEKDAVLLEDRQHRRRTFPLAPAGFLVDGRRVTLIRPRATTPSGPRRTASGSVAVTGQPAKVARASRLLVEGMHDAALVERVWGDDLRVCGVVVEVLDGVDALPGVVRQFRPRPGHRLGVLVDHLVPRSKEARIAAEVAGPHVLVTGHPYVDIWQAVKPGALGIAAWPAVPRGIPWKEGVCSSLGVRDPADMWRRVLAGVRSYADLEVPLLQAVERLVDFVTEPDEPTEPEEPTEPDKPTQPEGRSEPGDPARADGGQGD